MDETTQNSDLARELTLERAIQGAKQPALVRKLLADVGEDEIPAEVERLRTDPDTAFLFTRTGFVPGEGRDVTDFSAEFATHKNDAGWINRNWDAVAEGLRTGSLRQER